MQRHVLRDNRGAGHRVEEEFGSAVQPHLGTVLGSCQQRGIITHHHHPIYEPSQPDTTYDTPLTERHPNTPSHPASTSTFQYTF